MQSSTEDNLPEIVDQPLGCDDDCQSFLGGYSVTLQYSFISRIKKQL